MARIQVCTPASLLEAAPCTLCASDTELMAALAVILYELNNGSAEVSAMLTAAKCFKCDQTKHQQLAEIVNVLGNYLTNATQITQADVFAKAGCLKCAEPAAIRAIIVQQICVYFSALANPN